MGPSYILLPGLHGTGDLFAPLLGVMPAGVRRVVVAYPSDRVCGYGRLLKVIEDQVCAEEAMVLVGESFSGALALRFAVENPRRVRAVILVASFIGPSVPRVLCYMGAPLALLRVPLPDVGIRWFLSGFRAQRELVRQTRQAVWAVKPVVIASRVMQVSWLDGREALRRCKSPILYLLGARDRLVGARGVRRVRRVRPDVVVRTIDGPHLLLQVKPAESWREISRFVERTAGYEGATDSSQPASTR